MIDRDHGAALRRAGNRLRAEQPPIAGDPSAVTDRIRELAELGFDLFQIDFEQFPDTGDMELAAAEGLPRFSQ